MLVAFVAALLALTLTGGSGDTGAELSTTDAALAPPGDGIAVPLPVPTTVSDRGRVDDEIMAPSPAGDALATTTTITADHVPPATTVRPSSVAPPAGGSGITPTSIPTVATTRPPASTTTSTTAAPPVIPGLPWQLGATATEVAYTEDLILRTQAAVAKVPSIAAAEAMGYVRINADHLLKPKLLGDSKNLDPTAIESYIVSNRDGVDYISGAMYVLDLGKTMADVPDLGPLVTWHDHGGFCFNASAVIVGTDPVTGACPADSVFIADPPMTHIWSEPLKNTDGSVRTAAACGTFVFFDFPHGTSVPGCGSPLHDHQH